MLVAGPVGIGKSTELARAAKILHDARLVYLIRLDRFENMKRASVDQLLLRIAGQIVIQTLTERQLSLSHELRSALVRAGVLDETFLSRTVREVLALAGVPAARGDSQGSFEASPSSILRLALSEVSQGATSRVTLLIDGLEKMAEGPRTTEIFESLGMLSDDVDLVCVLPWSLAFGGSPDTMLRAGEHLVTLRALEVEGDIGGAGRTFLTEILARRLGLSIDTFLSADGPDSWHGSPELPGVVARAAEYSGGVPRTFLQLMADAGTYARMRHRRPWPDPTDLADAVSDQEDSFRRILRRGDNDAILAAIGRDGRELELERKIRLLTYGVLLERVWEGEPTLTVHPLVSPLLNPSNERRHA